MKACLQKLSPARMAAMLIAASFAAAGAHRLDAQDPSTAIEFRRLYVPQDQFESAPRDPGVRYGPMPKAEFEQLVELLRSSPPEARSALAARISQAEYRARLTPESELSGQAVLSIERPSRRVSGSAKQQDPGALLPLHPLGLALSSPHWPDDPPEDAVCGLDSQGQMSVLVRRSGSLVFDWTLRGTREPGGGWRYNFELPLTPSSALTLDLPSDLTLRASRGVVVQSVELGSSQRRWQLALGGNHRFWIHLATQDEAQRQERVPILRQSNTYSLSPRGLELTTQLTLDVPHEPARQIELRVDPSLRLLAARHGQTQVPWTVLEEAQTPAGSRVMLEFPEPLQGLGNVILLGATAPLVRDEPWQLPGVRVQGVFWQEGKGTLLVPKPLSLERLNLTDCRQSGIGALPQPAIGDSIGLQYFQPTASVEVVLAHGQQRLQASTGTAIELTEDAIQGRVVAELNVNEGQLFSLQGAVPHRWNIDNVQSDPPGRIKDWSLDTPTPRKRVLDVRLAKALSPSVPVRLVITGHRLNVAAGDNLQADELRMIDFTSGAGEHVMAVACPDTHQLRLTGGEELTRYNPQQVSLAVAALFTGPPEGLLFKVDPKAARLMLSMQRLAPRYSAEIRMTATATAGPLWENYEIQCRPQGSRVERVYVYFSQVRTEPPRWRLLGEGEDQLTVRKLSDEQMLAQCGRETGEMWELSLRRPRNNSFEVRASRSTPLGAQTPVSLIWLPGAETQDAQLLIRSSAEAAVNLVNSRLRPVPIDALAPGSLVRAHYRYLPAQDTAAADPPPLVLSRNENALSQTASVVWQSSLESRYEPSGMVHHTASWFLQNTGQTNLTLTIPDGVQLDDVWVDEDHVAARGAAALAAPRLRAGKLAVSTPPTGKQISVALPAGRRYPTVTLHFRTQESPLGEVRRFTAPVPTTSLPVLASEWTLWLPPGYSLAVRDGVWRQGERAPLSLIQRWLGPLARAGRPRFEPLRVDNWRQLAELPWEAKQARETADHFVDLLGQQPASTWGPMLSRLQPALELSQQTLLVDRHALWKAGIGPDTVVAAAEADSDRERGFLRLEASQLMLLVRSPVVLLTTPIAAANLSEQLAMLDHAGIAHVRSGNFGQRLEQAASQQGSARYCQVNQWLSQPLAPWTARRDLGNENVDTPGWGVYRLTGPSTVVPEVEIARQSTINVFSWGLFLLIVAACFRRFERPHWLVVAAGLSAMIALLVPELYASIGSSAFLGFVAALVWQAVARPAAAARVPASTFGYKLSDSVHTVATGVVLLVLWLAAASAWAEEAPIAVRPLVHKVLIPVDDAEQPVGDLYWVPENLYTQMERRAARLALEPQDWLLERADYRGTLNWDVAQQRLLASELRVRFDLSVFEPSRRVRLPLGREGYSLSPPDRILVDGMEVPAQWEDNGRLLVFDAPQPGAYRVELSLRPTVNSYADLSGLDLSIPPLATARLELQLPRACPAVDVVSAMGSVALDLEANRLTAHLGATPRLSIRWRDGALPSTIRTTVDADQLVWLKVQAGSLAADVRWKFKVLEGSVRQVQLALDPRLQLQGPLETRNSLVAQSRIIPGNPQLIQIELTRAVTDQFTLDASLRWAGASGVGNLRVPHVEAQQVRTLRRLLAISLDPLLEHRETPSSGLTSIPPADFAQQWGGMEAPPALAYRQTEDAAAWSLAVRPKTVQRKVDAVLAVSLSAGRSAWRYDATVDIVGSAFEHRLSTPKGLNIESVEVREEGVPRLSHWSKDAEGIVTLFLSEPSTGPQQIVLQGWTALPARGPWRLSSLRVEDAQEQAAQVRVYRQPSVAVDIRNRSGLLDQAELQRRLENQLFESDRRYVALGRLASVMKSDSPTYSANLSISPNTPRFECKQITTLKREGQDWQAELDCQVNVTAGLLDALRFEIPASWQAPFVVTPAADYELVETGDGGRQLVVRPVAAIAKQSRLRVRGSLVSPAGARLQLPSLSLIGAERLERFLVAPGQIDLQAVSWETRGLSRVEVPAEFVGSPGLAMPEAYLVVDDAFSATLQPAMRLPGQSQVALADISLSWQSNGDVQGVAAFDLQPSGNRECPLILPAGYRLVQVLVNQVPALARQEGNQQWRLTLASEELPQRVDVVFQGVLPPADWGRQRLRAPSLGDLPVERTLWTLRGPPGSELVEALQSRRVNAWRQEFLRLQSLAGWMNSVRDLSAGETVADLAVWYEMWDRRYRLCRAAVGREVLLARQSEAAAGVLAEVRELDQQHARFTRDVLGALPIRTASTDTWAEQPRHFWQFAFDTEQPPLTAAFEDRSTEIEVRRAASPGGDWLWRMLAAAGVAATVGAVLALVRSRWWPALHRWRYLAAVLLGLAWWIWLSPSIVGWLLVALAAVAAWRDRLPPREAGSAIVRLGTSDL